MPRVGVLALQGDVREHTAILESLCVEVELVRRPAQLETLDGLVIPGGESTAISHLLETSGLREPLLEKIDAGLPIFGTCAGLILLARDVIDGRSDQWHVDALDIAVRRNGYGRQVASFECDLDVSCIGKLRGVFIRAPRIEQIGPQVEVLATYESALGLDPVLVKQKNVVGCSFHPEMSGDSRIHAMFLELI